MKFEEVIYSDIKQKILLFFKGNVSGVKNSNLNNSKIRIKDEEWVFVDNVNMLYGDFSLFMGKYILLCFKY